MFLLKYIVQVLLECSLSVNFVISGSCHFTTYTEVALHEA